MKDNFDQCLKLVLKHEGGFVNHPIDPGGMTCLGVTKATWEGFTGELCNEADMRALTPEAVKPLYQKLFWGPMQCDLLPKGVDYAVFDLAVNSGNGRAAKLLQASVGAVPDGQIGPRTLEAIGGKNPPLLIRDICGRRLTFMRGLPTWKTFGRGWSRRVADVESKAVAMAQGQ
jgi:lysozyme family protein